MMCQMIGLPPISTMGLGRRCDSSLIRVPMPPARMTVFIAELLQLGVPEISPERISSRDQRRAVDRPGNVQLGIVPANRALVLGRVIVRHFIEELGLVGGHQESMGES